LLLVVDAAFVVKPEVGWIRSVSAAILDQEAPPPGVLRSETVIGYVGATPFVTKL
jgi:hypothetical protein